MVLGLFGAANPKCRDIRGFTWRCPDDHAHGRLGAGVGDRRGEFVRLRHCH